MYKVVSSDDLSKLAVQVIQLIKEGWKPQGGIAVGVGPNGYAEFYQAMVTLIKTD